MSTGSSDARGGNGAPQGDETFTWWVQGSPPGVRINAGPVVVTVVDGTPSVAPESADRERAEAPQRAADGARRAGTSPAPLARHTFECRLTGSESHRLLHGLSFPAPQNAVALAESVCAFLTRDDAPAAPASAIAGLEVRVELDGRDLACTVRLSDFPEGELVVVHVDAAVYRVGECTI